MLLRRYSWSHYSSTVIEEKDAIDDDEDQPFEDENNAGEYDEVSADVDGPSSDKSMATRLELLGLSH